MKSRAQALLLYLIKTENMMIKESTQQAMNQFWNSILDANEELNAFIKGGIPPSIEKRQKPFLKKWDRMKEKASVLNEEFESLADEAVPPVEIKMPWPTKEFKEEWQNWKDYLKEQHHKQMKSRMERAALQQLFTLSEENQEVAISYLHFAMAGGYQRFFKVTTRSYEQPNLNYGGRGDGDY